MSIRSIDALTRRASLVGIGAVGLGQIPAPVAAAKNRNKKRRKQVEKKARKKCQQQGEECIVVVEILCEGDVLCLSRLQPCCETAERCDFNETLNRIFFPEA